jgi:cyclopropane fatty-acyl-phospholipid synthase-like methyltransferase
MPPDVGAEKNREIYDHADDEIWQRAVYQPVHDGWHFANIGGRKFLDFIGERAGLGPESRVLDLCCGSGAAARYLAGRFGCAVTGLDINASQIERAKLSATGLERLRFLQADVCSWQPKRRYDLVFALDSLTLIANLSELFATCRTALRLDGFLAVAEVVAGANLSDDMRAFARSEDGAITLITADQLVSLIESAGFRSVEIVALRDEAVRAFTLIHRSVRQSADWHAVSSDKIEEWERLSERYLEAFASGELGYVRIVAAAS